MSHDSSENEWIEWRGGDMPVAADTLVHVRVADGNWSEDEAYPAGVYQEGGPELDWWRTGNLTHDWRITAYRVVQS